MGNPRKPEPEATAVRQYRYLLRTASVDALEAAHAEALDTLSEAVRQAVLTGVQDGLVAGGRLRPAEVAKVAHLLILGERRSPGAFLRACEPGALQALADATIQSEFVRDLLGGYAAWDGVDPEPTGVGEDHGGDGAHEALGLQVNAAKELARLHAAQTGVGASGVGF